MLKLLRKKLLSLSAFLFIVFAVSGIYSVKTQAMTLTGLRQTGSSTGSVTVQWNAVPGSGETIKGYTIKYRDYYGSGGYVTAATNVAPSARGYTLGRLGAGKVYNVQVEAQYVYRTNYGSYNRTTYASLYNAKTALAGISGLRQKLWYYFIHMVDVEWNRQTAADGYEVVCYKSNGKLKERKILNSSYSSRVSFSNVKNEMVYSVRVRAWQTINGRKLYTGWSEPIYCFTQPRITSAKIRSGKLQLKWKKVSGATGYRIFVSTKQNTGFKKVKTLSAGKSSVTIKKFKGKKFSAKKRYYVYVQTLKKVKGKVNTSGALYVWNTKNNSFSYLH